MDFDINLLRVIATVASFVTFIAIWGWAWSRKNRERFEEDGQIPFQQD
jgi:cytochrome c oxidase cbb3-type subunit 4